MSNHCINPALIMLNGVTDKPTSYDFQSDSLQEDTTMFDYHDPQTEEIDDLFQWFEQNPSIQEGYEPIEAVDLTANDMLIAQDPAMQLDGDLNLGLIDFDEDMSMNDAALLESNMPSITYEDFELGPLDEQPDSCLQGGSSQSIEQLPSPYTPWGTGPDTTFTTAHGTVPDSWMFGNQQEQAEGMPAFDQFANDLILDSSLLQPSHSSSAVVLHNTTHLPPMAGAYYSPSIGWYTQSTVDIPGTMYDAEAGYYVPVFDESFVATGSSQPFVAQSATNIPSSQPMVAQSATVSLASSGTGRKARGRKGKGKRVVLGPAQYLESLTEESNTSSAELTPADIQRYAQYIDQRAGGTNTPSATTPEPNAPGPSERAQRGLDERQPQILHPIASNSPTPTADSGLADFLSGSSWGNLYIIDDEDDEVVEQASNSG